MTTSVLPFADLSAKKGSKVQYVYSIGVLQISHPMSCHVDDGASDEEGVTNRFVERHLRYRSDLPQLWETIDTTLRKPKGDPVTARCSSRGEFQQSKLKRAIEKLEGIHSLKYPY